ncbi:MAG: hypothetical protein M3O70_25960 [Actinomycetota bacterium]|nr:hypothetical protein [Actinomycetota bacterium]
MSGYVDEASVQYNDWKGTAAADTADDPVSMADALGLDHERWQVLAVRVSDWEGSLVVTADCLRRELLLGDDDTLDALAARNEGALPVTKITFDRDQLGNDFGALIERLFKRFSVQLSDRYSGAGRRLQIEGELDFTDLES